MIASMFLAILISGADHTLTDTSVNVPPAHEASRRLPRCTELALGESVIINDSQATSPTGIPRRYRLSRSASDPNLYIADIKINFLNTYGARRERYGNTVPAPSDITPDNWVISTRDDEMQAVVALK